MVKVVRVGDRCRIRFELEDWALTWAFSTPACILIVAAILLHGFYRLLPFLIIILLFILHAGAVLDILYLSEHACPLPFARSSLAESNTIKALFLSFDRFLVFVISLIFYTLTYSLMVMLFKYPLHIAVISYSIFLWLILRLVKNLNDVLIRFIIYLFYYVHIILIPR